MNLQRAYLPLVVGALALVPPLFFREGATYISRMFMLVLIFATLAIALNIVFGHTDQLLLFTGALTGIGAYSTALLADSLGISPWATVIPGALLAGIVGGMVCYVAARRSLTVIVISILTLALQFAIIEVFTGARGLTGGDTGFRFSGLGLETVQESLGVHEHVVLYYIFLGILVGALLVYQRLIGSQYGLAFETIRQDEVAAEAAGIDVVRYKTLAGFIATFVIGFIGPFYVQLQGFVLPGMFAFNEIDVLVLIILIVGGIRTMYGPILGAALVVYIDFQLQGSAAQYRTAIFGLLLLFLFLAFRQGLVYYINQATRYVDDQFELSSKIPNR
ncbi:branched-chain amino acid ABC transporter permease [Natrarchaeobius sp. A-rgal3]|uniref:branched-chain amino acid ABC transporter permease n=1 Tax=Natrarchaeobius versutus TaxID=1679078 RepID=UPI003510B12A